MPLPLQIKKGNSPNNLHVPWKHQSCVLLPRSPAPFPLPAGSQLCHFLVKTRGNESHKNTQQIFMCILHLLPPSPPFSPSLSVFTQVDFFFLIYPCKQRALFIACCLFIVATSPGHSGILETVKRSWTQWSVFSLHYITLTTLRHNVGPLLWNMAPFHGAYLFAH